MLRRNHGVESILASLLLIIVTIIGLLPVTPVYSTSSSLGGFYDRVAYNYSLVLIGSHVGGWNVYSWKNKFSVIGLLSGSGNEGSLELVKLFGFSMPDSFAFKPVAVEDSFVKMYPNVYLPLGEKNNFLVVDVPSSIYLVGPLKYGGIGYYMSVYSYRRIEFISAEVLTGADKGSNITSYDDLKSFLHDLDNPSTLLIKVKIDPTVMKVLLAGDDRYANWNSLSLDCNGTVGCEGKEYLVEWFSMMYEADKLPPKGEEPKSISYYGMILTPFLNVTTWTYNPYYQYFVGSGKGIAWNESCKYGDTPTEKDKYTVMWMGPGDINEIYALRITKNPTEKCCHLPAYYINFLPMWCRAGKTYGYTFYNVSKVIDRVRNVPIGTASAYIPGTGVNILYSNGRLFFFKMNRPTVKQIHATTMPMVVYFNTTVRRSYTLPYSEPKLEMAVVPLELGRVRGLWFTSNVTMVVLDRDNRTLHLYTFSEPVNSNPSTILAPVYTRKTVLDHPAKAIAYNGSTIYIATDHGGIYRINGVQINKIGSIDPSLIDIGVYRGYLSVLYSGKIILYSLSNGLKKVFETPVNHEYRWIVPSRHYIFAVSDNYTGVYALEPKISFLSGAGIGEAKITVKPNETRTVTQGGTTTSPVGNHGSSVQTGLPESSTGPGENHGGESHISEKGLTAVIAVLIILLLAGYYYFKNK